jgi:predicted nucleic acid-binding protein
MSIVFLDTVGLIALWDNADQWHRKAQEAYSNLRDSRVKGITTDAVLWECGNAASRRPYRRDVSELRRRMKSQGLIAPISDGEWELAWQAYDRGDAANAGLVDQSSIIVMRRLGIGQVFTNDSHFEAAGFQILF